MRQNMSRQITIITHTTRKSHVKYTNYKACSNESRILEGVSENFANFRIIKDIYLKLWSLFNYATSASWQNIFFKLFYLNFIECNLFISFTVSLTLAGNKFFFYFLVFNLLTRLSYFTILAWSLSHLENLFEGIWS